MRTSLLYFALFFAFALLAFAEPPVTLRGDQNSFCLSKESSDEFGT